MEVRDRTKREALFRTSQPLSRASAGFFLDGTRLGQGRVRACLPVSYLLPMP